MSIDGGVFPEGLIDGFVISEDGARLVQVVSHDANHRKAYQSGGRRDLHRISHAEVLQKTAVLGNNYAFSLCRQAVHLLEVAGYDAPAPEVRRGALIKLSAARLPSNGCTLVSNGRNERESQTERVGVSSSAASTKER